jgi:hypothetical protein
VLLALALGSLKAGNHLSNVASAHCDCLNYGIASCRVILKRLPGQNRGRFVFYRLTIAKRVAAVCGIALTVLNCMQQTHAICQLTGCKPQNASEVRSSCCKSAAASTCVHSCHRVDEKPTGADHASIGEQGSHGPTCPSPENCVCCQAPPTPSQSSPVDAEFVTMASSSCNCCCSALMSVDVAAVGCDATTSRFAPERSIETCIRLCRFLA